MSTDPILGVMSDWAAAMNPIQLRSVVLFKTSGGLIAKTILYYNVLMEAIYED